MRLMKTIVALSLMSTVISSTTFAEDCGAPPATSLKLPSATSIDTTQLKSVRDQVVSYSENVDDYMSCMDQRGRKLLPYMTKDQQGRWEEDLTQLHEDRRQVQIALNDLIRAFRKKTSN